MEVWVVRANRLRNIQGHIEAVIMMRECQFLWWRSATEDAPFLVRHNSPFEHQSILLKYHFKITAKTV